MKQEVKKRDSLKKKKKHDLVNLPLYYYSENYSVEIVRQLFTIVPLPSFFFFFVFLFVTFM